MRYAGIDIGGTKCAVTLGEANAKGVEILKKERFLTDVTQPPENVIERFCAILDTLGRIDGIGVSCGGPLSSKTGRILAPPNLPLWVDVPVVDILQKRCGVPVRLQNDANACALAEWKFGAGRGSRNMVFMTFGTGLGAGLILDGKLYTGTNDNAGELGHIRLDEYGPVGYGKAGSFEGFCSGGGIRQLAQSMARERFQMGGSVSWCPDGDLEKITAKRISEAAPVREEMKPLTPPVIFPRL